MIEPTNEYRIFLSAAEVSGDHHCAKLIDAIKKQKPGTEFVGLGGDQMESAGCDLYENTVQRAAMTYQAFSQVVYYYKLLRRIKQYFRTNKIDLVIVCDSPALNFHIARIAQQCGIPTLFYVAPQLWAWAPWRIKKLHKWCDKLCCILPFEEEWFSTRGVDTSYVGNPLLDELASSKKSYRKTYDGFAGNSARIALLPGSRSGEIKTLWQSMQQVAVDLRRKWPGLEFLTVAVNDEKKSVLKSLQILGFRSEYTTGSVVEATNQCDFALVASGSATLQVAAAGCPMVIMYQSSALLWNLVGRWLITSKYLSLVNILAEKKIVPEFMPYFRSTAPITAAVEELLRDPEKLATLSRDLIDLTKPLRNKASQNVANIVLEILE